MSGKLERFGYGFHHPVRDAYDVFHPVDIFEYHDEFISAESDDGVVFMDGVDQPFGNLFQQGVACIVAEAFVDDLEAVDVEFENAEHFVVLPGPFDGAVEKTVEIVSVRQGSQWVEQRQVFLRNRFAIRIGRAGNE